MFPPDPYLLDNDYPMDMLPWTVTEISGFVLGITFASLLQRGEGGVTRIEVQPDFLIYIKRVESPSRPQEERKDRCLASLPTLSNFTAVTNFGTPGEAI